MKEKQPKSKPTYSSRFNRPSNYDEANIFSKFFLWFCFPTFMTGYKNNGLNFDDLHRCPVRDETERVKKGLERLWEKEKLKKNPNFAWTFVRANIVSWLFPFAFFFVYECFIYIVQPLMLGLVIRYFSNDPTVNRATAWWCIGGINACLLVAVTLDHPMVQVMQRAGCRWRVAVSALIYQKSLKLSRAAVGQTAASQITNILANDANRIDEFCTSAMYFIIAPIQMVIIVYIVWTYLGISSLIGLVILLLFIPFQGVMGKLFSKVRLSTALLTDSRLKYMQEIVTGIRVIKMYVWTSSFAARVAEARKKEVKQIRRCCNLKSLNVSVYFVATRIMLFATFIAYILLGGILSAEAVFVSMSLFNTLRLTMTYFFPMAITQGSELLVVFKRVQTFLLLEENETAICETSTSATKDAYLKMKKVTANWIEDKPTLKDISVDLQPGDLLVVTGPVGAGKSSFLMTLLKELPLQSGSIDLQGSISYASQDPWLFNDSVRNNILFGAEYDEKLYNRVVDVCALKRDFKLMSDGDRSLVGERGVSLSGGQRARINLARAVYRSADLVLLDDPLSAVDTSVAEHIFEKCIYEFLHDKIRVLVTHQIQFIEKASKILVIDEGKCLAIGSYQDIKDCGIDFMSLLTKKEDDGEKERTMSQLSGTLSEGALAKVPQTIDEMEYNEDKPVVIEEEQYERGSIKGHVYAEYIRAGAGIILLSSMIIFTIVSQAIFHGSDIFLTEWTNKNQQLVNGTKPDEEEQKMDIIYYSIIIAVLFISTVIRSMTFFAICMRASENLHNSIFARLLKAPMAFFDSTPSGQIMNRFTRDLGTVDDKIPYSAFDINLNFANIIGIVVTVSFVNYYLALPAIVFGVITYYVRKVYIKSARDIRRYEGVTRSPVYSHITNTINGLASIRAFGAQKAFEQQFYAYQNDHTSMWFLFISTSRAMGITMEAICSLYIVICSLAVMFSEGMEGGSAGLVISTGLMLTGMTQWGIRQSCEFESQMTSVERIVQYQELAQETSGQELTGVNKPSSDWPTNGEIEFDSMCLSYGEKKVLKDITLSINGGEKVGVVGRTGAGKSSIIAALFRLTEPTGAIRIDGVDTQKSVSLDQLRKAISIIPQEPVIFSGSVRYNLDPFNEYADDALWSSLESVQLKDQVTNMNGQLDGQLAEGGGNLSVGQRQLICLARAILRRSPILVLDEATANCDHQTDALIQKTIRTAFTTNTVITIAHRLNTVVDNSRILVLDAGEVLEFDTPYQLLKSRGAFYEMCQKTGPVMYQHLYQVAKKIHQQGQSNAYEL